MTNSGGNRLNCLRISDQSDGTKDRVPYTPFRAREARAARVWSRRGLPVGRQALERDDRAAVSERVPHRLPSTTGNRTGHTGQAIGGQLTRRAPMDRRRRSIHSLPARTGSSCTRYRTDRVAGRTAAGLALATMPSPPSCQTPRRITLRARVRSPVLANRRRSRASSAIVVRRALSLAGRTASRHLDREQDANRGRGHLNVVTSFRRDAAASATA